MVGLDSLGDRSHEEKAFPECPELLSNSISKREEAGMTGGTEVLLRGNPSLTRGVQQGSRANLRHGPGHG